MIHTTRIIQLHFLHYFIYKKNETIINEKFKSNIFSEFYILKLYIGLVLSMTLSENCNKITHRFKFSSY